MTNSEAIETLQANYPDACFGQLRDAVDIAISVLQQSEIIQCKDCYHYPNEYADCPMIGWARNENDFCSKAERKTDE